MGKTMGKTMVKTLNGVKIFPPGENHGENHGENPREIKIVSPRVEITKKPFP